MCFTKNHLHNESIKYESTFLLADKTNLRSRQHTKKLCLCAQVAKVLAEVDKFSNNRRTLNISQTRSCQTTGANPYSREWSKYIIALMLFVNNVRKTLRGMIIIL